MWEGVWERLGCWPFILLQPVFSQREMHLSSCCAAGALWEVPLPDHTTLELGDLGGKVCWQLQGDREELNSQRGKVAAGLLVASVQVERMWEAEASGKEKGRKPGSSKFTSASMQDVSHWWSLVATSFGASWRHHPVPMVISKMEKEVQEENHFKVSSEVNVV